MMSSDNKPFKVLKSRKWRAEMEAVMQAYITEFEMCRRELQALRKQVNEIAAEFSIFRKRIDK